MSNYIEDLIENYQEEDPINVIVYHIVNTIKKEANFKKALQIISDNKLSFEDLVSRSCRLNSLDITKLADLYIQKDKK